ncbi:MAG: arginine N-succinyltransferase [Pseudomonadota bacterium]
MSTVFEAGYRFRPVADDDIDGLMEMARLSGAGFSSLRPDPEFLTAYIRQSVDSFNAPQAQANRKHLLVLEAPEGDKIVGCAAVKTNIGRAYPFINFRYMREDGAPAFDPAQARFLDPSSNFDGATEIGSLFLHPDHRQSGVGRYLAKVRYLMIACAPHQFAKTLVSELRGVTDDAASATFYNHVYRDRLGISFVEADARYSFADEAMLAPVLPDGPLEIRKLPDAARAVMAEPNETGIGAMKLLKREGFRFANTIDLFDAGPIMSARRDEIETVRRARKASVVAGHDLPCLKSPRPFDGRNTAEGLVAAGGLTDFRAVLTRFELDGNEVRLHPRSIRALGIDEGAEVTISPQGQTIRTSTPRETRFHCTAPRLKSRRALAHV